MAYDADTSKTKHLGILSDPGLAVRFWQLNTMRLMRANETMLHGLMKAANRELELAREVTQFNLAQLQKFSKGAAPEQRGQESEANFLEFDHLLAGMREVSQEIWQSFGEASKVLLEGGVAEAKDAAIEPIAESVKK